MQDSGSRKGVEGFVSVRIRDQLDEIVEGGVRVDVVRI